MWGGGGERIHWIESESPRRKRDGVEGKEGLPPVLFRHELADRVGIISKKLIPGERASRNPYFGPEGNRPWKKKGFVRHLEGEGKGKERWGKGGREGGRQRGGGEAPKPQNPFYLK